MERNVNQTIGKNIRKLRLKKGLSQMRLAASADLSLGFIGSLERGEVGVTAESLVKIAKALEVPPGGLFQGL